MCVRAGTRLQATSGSCGGPFNTETRAAQELAKLLADHIPDQDAPAVAKAAHAAVQEAINAGVYVSAGGLANQPASIVATDGAVTDGPYPEAIGGFTLVDVPTREEALQWAAKIAVACRCAKEVREIGADPELDAMLRQADSRR